MLGRGAIWAFSTTVLLVVLATSRGWSDEPDAVPGETPNSSTRTAPLPSGDGPFYRITMELVERRADVHPNPNDTDDADEADARDTVQQDQEPLPDVDEATQSTEQTADHAVLTRQPASAAQSDADDVEGADEGSDETEESVLQEEGEQGHQAAHETIIARPMLVVPRSVPAVIAWGSVDPSSDSSGATTRYGKLPEKHRLELTIHRRSSDNTVTLTAVWTNTTDFIDLGQSQASWKTQAFQTTRKVAIGKKSILAFDAARNEKVKTALKLTVEELSAAELQAERTKSNAVR